MATETLKLQITADNAQAMAELNQLTQELKKLETNISKSTDPKALVKFSSELNVVKSRMEVVNAALNPILPKMQEMAKSSNTAAFALTNVGRVAQDLPFGFMGIQNNLNPLLESFQRLKAESGSTGGALKALGSSLIGAGGIGLAWSVASSAFLLFQNGMAGFNKKTEEAKKKTDEFTESLKKEREAAAGQISDLKANLFIAQNQNESLEKRKIAVQNLISSYPAYFQGLTTENALTKDLTKNIDDVTDALIKQARARAYSAKIEKLAGDDLALENKNAEIRLQRIKAENELQKERLNPTSRSGGGIGGASVGKEEILTKNIAEYNRQIVGNNIDRTKIYYEQLGLQNKINQAKKETILLEEKADKPIKEKVYAETKPKLKLEDFHGKQVYAEAAQVQQHLLDVQREMSAQVQKEYDTRVKMEALIRLGKPIERKLDAAPNKAIEEAQLELTNRNTEAQKILNEQMNDRITIAATLSDSFGQILSTMATAENPFQALTEGLKNMVIELGIAVARAVAFKAILMAIDPSGVTANLAGGGGGIGGILAGLFGGKRKQMAAGGIATSATDVTFGEAGPEAIMPLDRLNGFVDRAVRASSMNLNNGLAMQGGDMGGEFVLRGNDMVLMLQRAGYSLNLRR